MDHKMDKPVVYSCSGCSSSAQMANYIAVRLDRTEIAEMSCIAGVGGNVKKLVRTATSGREMIVIDGCPLACAKACLKNHGITPTRHIDLSTLGVKKLQREDFDTRAADAILELLSGQILSNQKIGTDGLINDSKTEFYEYRNKKLS